MGADPQTNPGEQRCLGADPQTNPGEQRMSEVYNHRVRKHINSNSQLCGII